MPQRFARTNTDNNGNSHPQYYNFRRFAPYECYNILNLQTTTDKQKK